MSPNRTEDERSPVPAAIDQLSQVVADFLRELARRLDSLERRIGVTEGNIDIRTKEHHRTVKFYYEVINSIHDLLVRAELMQQKLAELGVDLHLPENPPPNVHALRARLESLLESDSSSTPVAPPDAKPEGET